MTRVLFVCMGNICRSPTAEGVFRSLLQKKGLEESIEADSAGTHGYHIGEPPDPRSQEAAARRGYDLLTQRARQVSAQDMAQFDLVLAMDNNTLNGLKRISPSDKLDRISLFMDYASKYKEREVPDPYYGAGDGFERVLDMVEDASDGLIKVLSKS